MAAPDITERLKILARGNNLDLADIVCSDAITEIERLRDLRNAVTVGMVTAALAAVGEQNISLSSMRRREVTKMLQAALDWQAQRQIGTNQQQKP